MTSRSDFNSASTDATALRYVLGDLSDEERQRFEEGYVFDHDSFEQLAAVEDDLIDAYVRNELSAADRQRFETHFLVTPERRQRVELGRALAERDKSRRPNAARRSSPPRWLLGSAAAALAAVSFLYLLHGDGGVPPGSEPQQGPSTGSSSPAPPDSAGTRTIEPPPGAGVAGRDVDPLRSRSLVSRVEIVDQGGHLAIRVVLKDPGPHARYVLELENARAASVWSSPPLSARPAGNGSPHILEAELSALAPGPYFLILKGVSPPDPPEMLEQSRVTLPRR